MLFKIKALKEFFFYCFFTVVNNKCVVMPLFPILCYLFGNSEKLNPYPVARQDLSLLWNLCWPRPKYVITKLCQQMTNSLCGKQTMRLHWNIIGNPLRVTDELPVKLWLKNSFRKTSALWINFWTQIDNYFHPILQVFWETFLSVLINCHQYFHPGHLFTTHPSGLG